ncbi:hypothetical protein BG000_001915 [Podila horticola]|nr:hypothetical protein BG000_001915 [Podila horticola]
MVPFIQTEEALFGKKHSLHARGINQFSRSPILIHKRHDAAWRAKQAHLRKAKHSKHSKTHRKTNKHSKHGKHIAHKHTKHHNKSSHRGKKSSHQDKKKASLGHTPSNDKEKSSDTKSDKKVLGGSNHSTQPNKAKAKDQKQTAPKLESKAKAPASNVVPKVAPDHDPSNPSMAGAGGINTPLQGIHSSWGSSIPAFNNRPAQDIPATNPERIGAAKIIGLCLAPLAAVVAVAYGVVAYRRRTTRRNHRRQVLLDAEAAIAAANSPGDDDESSLMSAISYRPPAPFTSEVDVSSEGSINNNPEIVVGDNSLHQVPAPQRDASHADNYQDYSHVCQSQILGQVCTNHSISCFVALNHSSAGLDVPLSKTPASYKPYREMSSAQVTMDSVLSKE